MRVHNARVCHFALTVVLLSIIPACLPFLTPTIPVNQGPTRFAVVQPLQNQISDNPTSAQQQTTEISDGLTQFQVRTSEGGTSFAPPQVRISEDDDRRVRNGIYQEYRNDSAYHSWFTLVSTIQDSDTMLLIPEIIKLEKGSKSGSPAGTDIRYWVDVSVTLVDVETQDFIAYGKGDAYGADRDAALYRAARRALYWAVVDLSR